MGAGVVGAEDVVAVGAAVEVDRGATEEIGGEEGTAVVKLAGVGVTVGLGGDGVGGGGVGGADVGGAGVCGGAEVGAGVIGGGVLGCARVDVLAVVGAGGGGAGVGAGVYVGPSADDPGIVKSEPERASVW